MDSSTDAALLGSSLLEPAPPTLDAAEVYEANAEFVYRSLHRLGVWPRDLPDLLQEVFVVVHRRRADYDASRPLKGWLFGICVGLVRNYRRKAHRGQERLVAAPDSAVEGESPERALERSRQRERGARLLAELDPDKRAVFVMFEVEGMSGAAIAELLDVPLGTVHSRLHAARRALSRSLAEGESE